MTVDRDLYEPDLDDLDRAALGELDPMYPVVADVLVVWAAKHFDAEHPPGRDHYLGLFLDTLASAGYRVTPIDPGPDIDTLLPVEVEIPVATVVDVPLPFDRS